jgi:CRP/FNR family cyclic AMP-dependent transcriptional regulator
MIQTDTLKNIYLFKEMTPAELEKIAKVCDSSEVIAGQPIFISGQKADSFFVIQQGTINLSNTTKAGDDMQLTSLGGGSHFGEMPFLTGDTRTASAQAGENSYLIEIPYQNLKNLLNEEVKISEKFHRALALFLAKRLKNTTSDLTLAKEAKGK